MGGPTCGTPSFTVKSGEAQKTEAPTTAHTSLNATRGSQRWVPASRGASSSTRSNSCRSDFAAGVFPALREPWQQRGLPNAIRYEQLAGSPDPHVLHRSVGTGRACFMAVTNEADSHVPLWLLVVHRQRYPRWSSNSVEDERADEADQFCCPCMSGQILDSTRLAGTETDCWALPGGAERPRRAPTYRQMADEEALCVPRRYCIL